MSAAPTDLHALLSRLRDAGLRVGVTEAVRLERVLDLEPALDFAGLRRLVTGVVAKSRDEVEEIAGVLESWRGEAEVWLESRWSSREERLAGRRFQAVPVVRIERLARRLSLRWWRWLFASIHWRRTLAAVLLLVALEGLLFWSIWPRDEPLGELPPPWQPKQVTEAVTERIDPEANPLLPRRPETFTTSVPEIRVLPREPSIAQVLALVAVAWLTGAGLWWRNRSKSWLPAPAPRPSRSGPSRILLRPPRSREPELLRPAEEEALVWGIERFVTEEPGERLDIPASVAATAANAGRPVIHFERARHHREVWLWCDAAADDPFLGRLADEVQASLEAVGLVVERAQFWGVPHRLVATDGVEMAPNELDERRDAAIVAVLTDGRLLALELENAERQGLCEALLRDLSLWPRLAFIDFGDGRTSSLLGPRKLDTVAPSAAFAFLGGVLRPSRRSAGPAGDLKAWAAACALPAQAVDEVTAHALRRRLGLAVSVWDLRGLFSEEFGGSGRLSFSAVDRARRLRWLLAAEELEDGRIDAGSLLGKALDFWEERYAAEEKARREADDVIPWVGTPAEQRLALERALLRLWRAPEEATAELYGLFRAGADEAVRRALGELAPADHPKARWEDEAVILPWSAGGLPARVQVMLQEMGFGARWGLRLTESLRRPGRLLVGVGLCLGLVVGGLSALLGQLLKEPTVHQAAETEGKLRISVQRVEGTFSRWQVDVTAARTSEATEIGGGREIEVTLQKGEPQECTVRFSRADVWHCGYLAEPLPSAPDWPTFNLAFLEADLADPDAAWLAARLLDSDSVSLVYLYPDMGDGLSVSGIDDEARILLFSSNKKIFLEINIEEDPQQRTAIGAVSERGVVVSSTDWRTLATALEFTGARTKPIAAVWNPALVRGDSSIRVASILEQPGALKVNETDGSVLVRVPGAEQLSGFWIGKYEVTNWQYRRYMAAVSDVEPPGFWNSERFNRDLQPVVGVSPEEAEAYCAWAGMQIPSHAQWVIAALGYDQRPYPWGTTEPNQRLADFGQDPETGTPALVTAHPAGAGPYGTLGQAGGVWEVTKGRTVHGGSWNSPADLVHGRGVFVTASMNSPDIGFRCILPDEPSPPQSPSPGPSLPSPR